MALILHDVLARIDGALELHATIEQEAREEEPPEHDRMSAAGRCVRDRWATRNGIPTDPGKAPTGARIQRVFALGHTLEVPIIDWLTTAGFTVHSEQLEVGEGDWLGHIDGIIEWYREDSFESRTSLLEMKTANAKKFAQLQDSSYCEWNPGYADQIQAYLRHLDDIDSALVVVLNKDTCELWVEEILEDKARGDQLAADHEIVMQDELPPRPKGANGPGSKFCKWKCDRSDWCYSPLTDTEWA